MTPGVVVAVALGAFLGGAGRSLLAARPGGLRGTWAANLLAVVILGAVLGSGQLMTLAVGAGAAGALSTWSTLARELGDLLQSGAWRRALGYAAATLTAGLAVAWLLVHR